MKKWLSSFIVLVILLTCTSAQPAKAATEYYYKGFTVQSYSNSIHQGYDRYSSYWNSGFKVSNVKLLYNNSEYNGNLYSSIQFDVEGLSYGGNSPSGNMSWKLCADSKLGMTTGRVDCNEGWSNNLAYYSITASSGDTSRNVTRPKFTATISMVESSTIDPNNLKIYFGLLVNSEAGWQEIVFNNKAPYTTVFSTAPTLAILNSGNSTIYKGAGQAFSINGTMTDTDGDTVTVSSTIGGVTKTTNVKTGPWILTWSADELVVGNYTNPIVTATDPDGKSASATYNGTLGVAVNNAPILKVTNNNIQIQASNNASISGTIQDLDNDSVTVSATINGKTKQTTITGTSSIKPWVLTWSGNEIAEGQYTNVVITASDGK